MLPNTAGGKKTPTPIIDPSRINVTELIRQSRFLLPVLSGRRDDSANAKPQLVSTCEETPSKQIQ